MRIAYLTQEFDVEPTRTVRVRPLEQHSILQTIVEEPCPNLFLGHLQSSSAVVHRIMEPLSGFVFGEWWRGMFSCAL